LTRPFKAPRSAAQIDLSLQSRLNTFFVGVRQSLVVELRSFPFVSDGETRSPMIKDESECDPAMDVGIEHYYLTCPFKALYAAIPTNHRFETKQKSECGRNSNLRCPDCFFSHFPFFVVSDCLMSACGLGTSFEIRISRRGS
jgi:hypothetical protein